MGIMVAVVAAPAPASAQLRWLGSETIATVGGMTAPDVAIDERGRMAVVYSSTRGGSQPRVELAARTPGGRFERLGSVGDGYESPEVVASAAGSLAVAAMRDDRLWVTVLPSPGPDRSRVWDLSGARTVELVVEDRLASYPQIGIDASGAATVVWTATPRHDGIGESPPSEIYTAIVTAAGASAVQRLTGPNRCGRPLLDVNAAGAAVVSADCFDGSPDVFYRPAGGPFGPGERFPQLPVKSFVYSLPGPVHVRLDGQGNVFAWRDYDGTGGPKNSIPDYRTQYALRPPDGPFGPGRDLGSDVDTTGRGPFVALDVQEDGRLVAAWASRAGAAYAIRPRDGGFGRVAVLPGPSEHVDVDLTAARRGPVLLRYSSSIVTLASDGSAGSPQRLPTGRSALAADEKGRAVAVWSRRCLGWRGVFWTIEAAVRDSGRTGFTAPCLGFPAPRVTVRPESARAASRALRLTLRCSEACRLRARGTVSVGGERTPIARMRVRRAAPLPGGRYRRIRLPLSTAEARRVGAALAAGDRLTLRLRLTARDRDGRRTVVRVARRVRR